MTRMIGGATEVLLLRRRNTGRGDGSWDCPAGGVELGETLEGAAVRELMEEVGLVADPQLVEVYRELVGTESRVLHVFLRTTAWHGNPRNLEPTRADKLGWFPLDQLPSPMLPFVLSGLRGIKDS